MPGRNELCPCGSGLKVKRCHGRPVIRTAAAVPPEVLAQIAQKARRLERFGHVRDPIHAQVGDHKLVAVGSEIHWAPATKWRTFPDFLDAYIKGKLGKEWGTAEISKPEAERHPIIRLYQAGCRAQNTSVRGPNGIYESIASGPLKAFLALAYDLYVVADNLALERRMLERLRKVDQFQGARYELFAAATCIRAGFSVELEDERDGSVTHPEFRAHHKAFAETIAVEAKSRHRPGVLGQRGTAAQLAEAKAGARGLLEGAFVKAKNVSVPYVILVDLNLPGPFGRDRLHSIAREIGGELRDRSDAYPSEAEPYTAVVCTNHPWHYGNALDPAPGKAALLTLALRPTHPFKDRRTLPALWGAIQKFGQIPNTFDE